MIYHARMLTFCGGSAIRKRREELCLSVSDVTKMLFALGVDIHDDTLRNWEANESGPDAMSLGALAEVLKLSIKDLYFKT